MNRLTRDGTAEPVSRDQMLRRERGQGDIFFLCSGDHVQDWQPYPVDPYTCYMCDHGLTKIHIQHAEYIVPFSLPDGVFLPFNHGLTFYISLCENSSTKRTQYQT